MNLNGLPGLIGGLALLILGAELLVKGSSRIAARFGVPPILIALTIVGFGTSAPELMVSLLAGMNGQAGLALGNVVGSNSFNIGVILGLSALARPLRVEEESIRREVPFVIGAPLVLWFLCRDGVLGRGDGVLLLGLFFAFIWWSFRFLNAPAGPERRRSLDSVLESAGFAAAGLGCLVFGADFFNDSAISIARDLGISDTVIGLTIVAAGTSMPELATSLVAAIRSKDDISVGNVTGSNVFNVLFILGIVAVIFPIRVPPSILRTDIWVMAAFSLAVLPIMKSGMRITRLEGGLLLSGYAGYIWAILR